MSVIVFYLHIEKHYVHKDKRDNISGCVTSKGKFVNVRVNNILIRIEMSIDSYCFKCLTFNWHKKRLLLCVPRSCKNVKVYFFCINYLALSWMSVFVLYNHFVFRGRMFFFSGLALPALILQAQFLLQGIFAVTLLLLFGPISMHKERFSWRQKEVLIWTPASVADDIWIFDIIQSVLRCHGNVCAEMHWRAWSNV